MKNKYLIASDHYHCDFYFYTPVFSDATILFHTLHSMGFCVNLNDKREEGNLRVWAVGKINKDRHKHVIRIFNMLQAEIESMEFDGWEAAIPDEWAAEIERG